ncbi:MAG: sulfite exporter TauE/SafE family protein [Phycisphaerae bacterium]|nr:sulfite exporter TauE/SafE family protein [Phycisphaerae bacterium]
MGFSALDWVVIALCAGLTGLSKTGVPGTGILAVPLIALVMPARQSTGFLLPMLILADVMAILYWRRHVHWRSLGRLLPWTLVGLGIGYVCLGRVTDGQLKPIIGGIVLVLVIGAWIREARVPEDRVPTHWAFAAAAGVLAGVTTMMANAAGPIMAVYLLAMRFDKRQFIGTQAWFFWIVNLSKLPLSGRLGLVTAQTLQANLLVLPAILAGGVVGILLVHRISQKTFNAVVRALAIAAGAYLCAGGWM